MPVTLEIASGHAESPSNDGWVHTVPTGRTRLTLDGPTEEVLALEEELKLRARAGSLRVAILHDGPGAASCFTCSPAPEG